MENLNVKQLSEKESLSLNGGHFSGGPQTEIANMAMLSINAAVGFLTGAFGAYDLFN
ncbi:hypothetical protein [uncultured Eudoraea sp.]|uniref:hypothetical protein n=1 Tax=uncultured Eudoraea sp. TaxID=1035614 RepID=UPI002634D8E8|nr:hypothetical protein [uncultured Eudoraea sp.]